MLLSGIPSADISCMTAAASGRDSATAVTESPCAGTTIVTSNCTFGSCALAALATERSTPRYSATGVPWSMVINGTRVSARAWTAVGAGAGLTRTGFFDGEGANVVWSISLHPDSPVSSKGIKARRETAGMLGSRSQEGRFGARW